MRHSYSDVNFHTVLDDTDGLYFVSFNSGQVIGTHSKSRGEAAMRFAIMLDAMLDPESKHPAKGDLVVTGDETLFICNLYPLMVCKYDPDTQKFLGPVHSHNYDPDHYKFELEGNTKETSLDSPLEWDGTSEESFVAYQGSTGDEGIFEYVKEVNIWRVLGD